MIHSIRQTIQNLKSKIRNPRNPALALLLFVFGAYLLTMSGHTYSPDEETMLEASRQLVSHGSWAVPQSRSFVEVTGADGRKYSQYGPGQSFAAVPWVGAGLLVGGLFPKNEAGFPLRLLLGSFNALVVAGTAGLLAALGMLLGYGKRAGLFAGGALAFCTFVWPHSRTFFSEPLTGLLLLGSFYLLARARFSQVAQGNRTWLWLAMSGALLALALAVKIQYTVALPAFGLYLLWQAFFPRRSTEPVRRQPLRTIAVWGASFIVGLLPLLLYNWATFGSPLTTGYGSDFASTFKTPLWEGVYGLLLSPGKGLVWYALPVLLSIWGVWSFARRYGPETVFIGVLSVCIVALFALYSFWHGDGSWGPRYLAPLLPFLLLPSLPVFQSAIQNPKSKIQNPKYAIALILALGFFVNLMGALVNFDTYINMGYDDPTRHFTVYASPIVGHTALLSKRVELQSVDFGKPANRLVLKGGVSYSEGDKTKGELLPRWTTGNASMQVWVDQSHGPALLTARLTDHRPATLGVAHVTILVNGTPVAPQTQPIKDAPSMTDYTFPVGTRPATVAIQSDTWNPSDVGEERNEVIGVRLESVTANVGGQTIPLAMTEALPAPPYYPQPRWYYDPSTQHPADLWEVYLLESGIGRKAMLALAAPVVLVALACILLGVLGLRGRSPEGG